MNKKDQGPLSIHVHKGDTKGCEGSEYAYPQ